MVSPAGRTKSCSARTKWGAGTAFLAENVPDSVIVGIGTVAKALDPRLPRAKQGRSRRTTGVYFAAIDVGGAGSRRAASSNAFFAWASLVSPQ